MTTPTGTPDALGPALDPPGTDEVDRIVAAWQQVRPDLDVSPFEVFSRVSRLARHLERRRAAVLAAQKLENWEFDVLVALRRSGEPYQLSAGALSAESLVSSGTMTNRVDRLVKRGLVTRRPDPNDGRGVLVELSGPGRELVDAALTELLDWERGLLHRAGLEGAAESELGRLLRSLLTPFDRPE